MDLGGNMGIFDWVKDKAKKVLDFPNELASDVYHKATGAPTAAEKRDQANMMNEQIRAYREQTELAKKQMDDARAAKDVEKRRINEKQIRSLRNNFRPAGGFLNNQGNAQPNAGLGNSSGLPSKLGAT